MQRPERSRARLVRISSPNKNTLIVPDDPLEFCRFARNHVRIRPTDPFDNDHLHRLSTDLRLTPVAYHNPGNHWTLVTDATRTPDGITLGVWDPTKGLREIQGYGLTKVWYFWGKENELKFAASDLITDQYSLPREPLDQLGSLQEDPVNCGPLTVFAARLVRRVMAQSKTS